jgi:hypothetical protein
VFSYCNNQVHRDFLITLYKQQLDELREKGRYLNLKEGALIALCEELAVEEVRALPQDRLRND